MVKKSPTTAGVAAVVVSKKENAALLPVTLQSVEITQGTIERKVLRSEAPKGKIDTGLFFKIEKVSRNGKDAIIGLLKVELTGRSVEPDAPQTFAISFELEGVFFSEDSNAKITQKNLTKGMAERMVHELHPLAMMRASELLSMIGYSGVRFAYGLPRSSLDQAPKPLPSVK